eukprot:3855290-Amphidinium_carterae.1
MEAVSTYSSCWRTGTSRKCFQLRGKEGKVEAMCNSDELGDHAHVSALERRSGDSRNRHAPGVHHLHRAGLSCFASSNTFQCRPHFT